EKNLTGLWTNHSPGGFLAYSADLLVGRRRGFLFHNLPLWLALPGAGLLLWRRGREWPEVLFAFGFCGGTWLVYAYGSTLYGGRCCSIRWFIPLLAPGFHVLIL